METTAPHAPDPPWHSGMPGQEQQEDGLSREEVQSQGRSCREQVDGCLPSLLDAGNKSGTEE